MLTKILVALSASSTDTVLDTAMEIAKEHQASIVALHVVDTVPCCVGTGDYHYGPAVEVMREHGNATLAHAREVLDSDATQTETQMLMLPVSGTTVGEAIAARAEASGATLIVLGERKQGWWRWLSEDVAKQVRRHTSTPVQVAGERSAA